MGSFHDDDASHAEMLCTTWSAETTASHTAVNIEYLTIGTESIWPGVTERFGVALGLPHLGGSDRVDHEPSPSLAKQDGAREPYWIIWTQHVSYSALTPARSVFASITQREVLHISVLMKMHAHSSMRSMCIHAVSMNVVPVARVRFSSTQHPCAPMELASRVPLCARLRSVVEVQIGARAPSPSEC